MPKRQVLSFALAGLGLILSVTAIWGLFTDARSGYAARPTAFAAIPINVAFDAPSLALNDLRGAEHRLSDFLGQVVLVNLWATWCPPCAAEMPVYQRFYEQHGSEGFTVIAVNDGEPEADVRSFIADHGLTFPVWMDPAYEATDGAFKTKNLPSSYVIDRAGMVRLMWIGAISDSSLAAHVVPLIKE